MSCDDSRMRVCNWALCAAAAVPTALSAAFCATINMQRIPERKGMQVTVDILLCRPTKLMPAHFQALERPVAELSLGPQKEPPQGTVLYDLARTSQVVQLCLFEDAPSWVLS